MYSGSLTFSTWTRKLRISSENIVNVLNTRMLWSKNNVIIIIQKNKSKKWEDYEERLTEQWCDVRQWKTCFWRTGQIWFLIIFGTSIQFLLLAGIFSCIKPRALMQYICKNTRQFCIFIMVAWIKKNQYSAYKRYQELEISFKNFNIIFTRFIIDLGKSTRGPRPNHHKSPEIHLNHVYSFGNCFHKEFLFSFIT